MYTKFLCTIFHCPFFCLFQLSWLWEEYKSAFDSSIKIAIVFQDVIKSLPGEGYCILGSLTIAHKRWLHRSCRHCAQSERLWSMLQRMPAKTGSVSALLYKQWIETAAWKEGAVGWRGILRFVKIHTVSLDLISINCVPYECCVVTHVKDCPRTAWTVLSGVRMLRGSE